MCSSACCTCCGYTSASGVVFFLITAAMVFRENTVFLTHKAGIGLHEITEEKVHQKFMVMLYTALVSDFTDWRVDLTLCFVCRSLLAP